MNLRSSLTLFCAIALGILFSGIPPAESASLTWDPDGNLASDGGDGTWDTSSSSWINGGAAATWTNGDDATFGKKADNSTNVVTVDSASNVTVKNITLEAPNGTGAVNFVTNLDNTGLTVAAGGGTWELGGRTIQFVNNNDAFDTTLSMTSGDTLVVTDASGGGVFNTGEKPGGAAAWSVSGATLDIRDGVTLRGQKDSVGQYATVILGDGTKYFHQRDQAQTYNNDWVLNGAVAFDNRLIRNYTLTGTVSGSGSMSIEDLQGQFVRLTGNNTFEGGIVVDSTNTRAELQLNASSSDASLGAVPGSFDPNYITLRNGGELKMTGININSNRGIALDGGGIIVLNNAVSTYGGTISGTGGLQIGRDQGGDGNTLRLTSNTHTYTGDTRIYQGKIELGIDNAIPTDHVLTIGGKGQSKLWMDGFDQEIGGLESTGGNTRIIENGSNDDSLLTINVPVGEDYNFGSNWDDRTDGSVSGNLSIVKKGLGIQRLTKSGAVNDFNGTVTVDQGTLIVNNDGFSAVSGTWTVNADGTLGGNGIIGADIDVVGGTVAPGTSPGTLSTGGLQLDSLSLLDFELEGLDLTVGGGVNDLIDITGDLILDGTLDVSEITASGFLSATAGQKWRLANYTGTLTDNGLDLGSLPALSPGLFFEIESGAGEVNLVVSAIPEPAAAWLLGIGGLALGFRRSRSRKLAGS